MCLDPSENKLILRTKGFDLGVPVVSLEYVHETEQDGVRLC